MFYLNAYLSGNLLLDNEPVWKKINTLPPVCIMSGTIETIKWLALVSMTIDHINRFFFNFTLYSAYCAGRLAMPLFAFIFAYNLAQPDAFSRGLYGKVIQRLIIFGLMATPAYIAMRHLTNLLPLNIMFMLATAAATLFFLEQGGSYGRVFATVVFLIGGTFVDYNWIGILLCLSSWLYCKKPTLIHLSACVIVYLFLNELNGNYWAMLCLIIIALAHKIEIKLPRIPHFFYYYYTIHLWFFYLIKQLFLV